MFCPNCGKDCGDANFCSHCGSKLADAAARPRAWSVGMPCPHCGGTKLEGNNCAFCGAVLKEDNTVGQKTWQNLPLGTWECLGGYLKLKEKVIVLKNGHAPEFTIPYEQIEKVAYKQPGLLRGGVFSVRGKENAHIPFPTSHSQEYKDQSTVLYFPCDRDFFFQLYHALNDYINNNR